MLAVTIAAMADDAMADDAKRARAEKVGPEICDVDVCDDAMCIGVDDAEDVGSDLDNDARIGIDVACATANDLDDATDTDISGNTGGTPKPCTTLTHARRCDAKRWRSACNAPLTTESRMLILPSSTCLHDR